jgi:putative membrane protein
MMFLLRGSVMPRILPVLIFNVVVATIVTLTHGTWFHTRVTLTAIPFSLLGLPLAIFLGFRNTAAFDRYWEARKLWGELVLRCHNFNRQCLCMIDVASDGATDIQKTMLYRAAAFAYALKMQLRRDQDDKPMRALLSEAELAQAKQSTNPYAALMLNMGRDLRTCQRAGRIDNQSVAQIDNTLSGMVAAAAACERISNTPVPFSYTLLLHRTAYVYCFLLPFGLVDTLTFMTPLVVAVVAYTFFGLDALGDEIEEPFGEQPNDLPLNAICRSIEISVREALGEQDIPPMLEPVDYCLM